MDTEEQKKLEQAAQWILEADALWIGAGAGMGVDSGLPDFRGNEGFWKAYPPFHGKSFAQIANPQNFFKDARMAWGFYGHRLNLYRQTQPHRGFEILKSWIEKLNKPYFIYTSNVDGQFQKAGFADQKIVECHGSLVKKQFIQLVKK
jgi:NAD-dependent SIR2 family protein deacetylase